MNLTEKQMKQYAYLLVIAPPTACTEIAKTFDEIATAIRSMKGKPGERWREITDLEKDIAGVDIALDLLKLSLKMSAGPASLDRIATHRTAIEEGLARGWSPDVLSTGNDPKPEPVPHVLPSRHDDLVDAYHYRQYLNMGGDPAARRFDPPGFTLSQVAPLRGRRVECTYPIPIRNKGPVVPGWKGTVTGWELKGDGDFIKIRIKFDRAPESVLLSRSEYVNRTHILPTDCPERPAPWEYLTPLLIGHTVEVVHAMPATLFSASVPAGVRVTIRDIYTARPPLTGEKYACLRFEGTKAQCPYDICLTERKFNEHLKVIENDKH